MPGSGAPELSVPLTLRDGLLFLGASIPLARLPRLDWPGS
jgi:hypothetical protein